MRFSYDGTKVQPSNLKTNEITNNTLEYFEFEEEFKQALQYSTIPYEGEGEGIRGTIAFRPPVSESEHIIDKEGIGKVVNTDGGVLLGKMSFQMTADVFDVEWFHLVENEEDYPHTGIKININGIKNYQAQYTFRFTDEILSKDASLSNLILSRSQEDEEIIDKEYELTPTFNKDILNYELTLLEDVDIMKIKATQNDTKATMKVKLPKIDEEKEIQNNVPLEILLNELGEEDTKVTIIVTAEDGKTKKEYTITIKRPFGTIKGSIHTINADDIHIADVKLYDNKEQIDWENLEGHDEIDLIETATNIKTKEDGNYEIKVIPGTYDVLMDKKGYLDYIVTEIAINQNDEIDLGNIQLIPGDVNKDGIVEAEDLTCINIYYDVGETEADYEEAYDLNEDGIIEGEDLTYINIYYDTMKTVKKY